LIKNSKKKAQASIQGDVVRISSKDRDTLQELIAMVKQQDFGIDLQFTNYRSNCALVTATTSINGKEIFDLLRDDIVAIEEQFGRDTVSNVAAITEIGEYLRAGGGKRIRPALLLLSAKLLGYKGKGAVKLATVVEIIHTATLVHDDIIDEAQIRRGRPAAN